MTTPVRVLLVDDKEDYCKSLSGPARHHNIQIVYNLDWETGFERLKKDPLIEFVILDGKGKIEADQETEKDNFVIRAMLDIDKYAKGIQKDIPYCVNTGFMERFGSLEGNVTIFEKSDGQRDKMFQFILDEVIQSKYRTLRLPFEEAFDAVDMGIISKDYEALLIEIIESYNKKDFRKKNINVQRDLFEAILKSLNTSIPCIPKSLFNEKNGAPNHESCTRFIEDRSALGSDKKKHKINLPVPQNIKSAFRKLKESTNEYSHLSDEVIVKIPFLANTFLLMEILEWLPGFARTHYKNHI